MSLFLKPVNMLPYTKTRNFAGVIKSSILFYIIWVGPMYSGGSLKEGDKRVKREKIM